MKQRLSTYTTRLRIEQIEERTENTILPKIDDVYARSCNNLDRTLSKDIVDKMIFSSYSQAKYDGTSAISAFLMYSGNVEELKHTGTLGAIIELLRRSNIENKCDSEHVKNLANSLYALFTTNGGSSSSNSGGIGVPDKHTMERFISHPHSICVILSLCRYMIGRIQENYVELLSVIIRTDIGSSILIKEKKLIITLTSYELLHRTTTNLRVKHIACNLINRLSAIDPKTFPVELFEERTVDCNGNRTIDAYMEIQLLTGFVNYLLWLESNNHTLNKVFLLLPYFINEIIYERYDNLEHLQLIIRCMKLLSNDIRQLQYMIDSKLNISLQYLSRNDFSLFNKKPIKQTINQIKTVQRNCKFKRLSINDTGERPIGTIQALSLVKVSKSISKNSDVNFICTEAALYIFKNIISYNIDSISEVVSSGLLPALLFRVGKDNDLDVRFNRMMTNFLHYILIRVFNYKSKTYLHSRNYHNRLALSGVIVKPTKYTSLGDDHTEDIHDIHTETTAAVVAAETEASTFMFDIRSLSSSFHVQGVTPLFIHNLHNEDTELAKMSCICLSIMTYSVVKDLIKTNDTLYTLFNLCQTRNTCYFQALAIICSIICSDDTDVAILTHMITELKVIRVLCQALKVSGWVMGYKSYVIKALAKLSYYTTFRDKILECHGMADVVAAIRSKRKNTSRRHRDDDDGIGDDDSSSYDNSYDILFFKLKEDYHVIKIQASLLRKLIQLRNRKYYQLMGQKISK